MTRRFTASLAMIGLFALIGLDLALSAPNPYHAPPAFALGSGLAASGAFCGAVPE